jgi:polyisoprenyl-teichoic acid--peptidoglycan teichoic acid transferase
MKIYGNKRRKSILILIGIPIFICISILGGLYLYIRHNIFAQRNNVPYSNQFNYNKFISYYNDDFFAIEDGTNGVGEDNDIVYEEQKGITNILLIGTDGRNLSENSRSDSIIIATIDDINRNLKLTSILRDTYVSIPKFSQQKINAAFALGGPELLMDTIEKNFRIKLDKYIIVNFWGFEDMIDALGGIEIEVKDYEIGEINKYIGEVRDQKSPALSAAGVQRLDGQQSLAYARIRKVGNGSYERSQRQRELLAILAQKIKDVKLLQYPVLLGKVLPCIKTNIEPINFLNYAYTVSKFKPLEVKQLQMPMTELSDGRIYRGTWVFLMDKDQNAKVLNDFIFKDKITDKNELNMKSFRLKINEYLRSDIKSNSTLDRYKGQVKEESENIEQ